MAIDLRVPPQVTGMRDDLEELLLRKGVERVPALAKLTAHDAILAGKVRTMRTDAGVVWRRRPDPLSPLAGIGLG